MNHETGNTIISWLFPAFCVLVALWQILATLWARYSGDPVTKLRRAIISDASMAVCAKLTELIFTDPVCATSLIDYQFTKKLEKTVFKPAGLSQLLIRDEKFNRWRQDDPKHQQHFVRVIQALRDLVPEHVHDI